MSFLQTFSVKCFMYFKKPPCIEMQHPTAYLDLKFLFVEVRSPAGAKDFSSNLCVQTGSEAHPGFCTMGAGGPFPGAKGGRGVTLTTHPHVMPRSRISRNYNSSPLQAPPWRVAGLLCFCSL
jgi:hypothetical protein